MKRWEVTGADHTTGAEQTVALDGEDEREVLSLAKKRGLLVSKVKPLATVDYAGPATPAKVEILDVDADGVPMYRAVVMGAKVLAFFGKACYVEAAVAAAVGLAQISRDESRSFGVAAIISAGFSCAAGALLILMASLALAVRDIARNSFRRP